MITQRRLTPDRSVGPGDAQPVPDPEAASPRGPRRRAPRAAPAARERRARPRPRRQAHRRRTARSSPPSTARRPPRAQAMSRGVSPITIVCSRGGHLCRRAGGRSRAVRPDPRNLTRTLPGPAGNHRPIPARRSFSRATGSKLPVSSPSVTPSRAASQGSSSGDPRNNVIAEVGRADLRVDPAARLAHVVGALVDPPRRHAEVEQDQRGRSRRRSGPRVRSAGAGPSCRRRAPRGSRVERLAVGLGGAGQQRAVDVEQQQH